MEAHDDNTEPGMQLSGNILLTYFMIQIPKILTFAEKERLNVDPLIRMKCISDPILQASFFINVSEVFLPA